MNNTQFYNIEMCIIQCFKYRNKRYGNFKKNNLSCIFFVSLNGL